MSATRTAQAYPGTQQLAAAFGVVLLAIAIMLIVAVGVLATPKASVSSPSSGAAPAVFDHGSISDPANVSGPAVFDHGSISDPANVAGPASFDHGSISDSKNVTVPSKSFTRGDRLHMPR